MRDWIPRSKTKMKTMFEIFGMKATILIEQWCTCKGSAFGDEIFQNDNECKCGVNRHHYHCPQCGGITQVGWSQGASAPHFSIPRERGETMEQNKNGKHFKNGIIQTTRALLCMPRRNPTLGKLARAHQWSLDVWILLSGWAHRKGCNLALLSKMIPTLFFIKDHRWYIPKDLIS